MMIPDDHHLSGTAACPREGGFIDDDPGLLFFFFDSSLRELRRVHCTRGMPDARAEDGGDDKPPPAVAGATDSFLGTSADNSPEQSVLAAAPAPQHDLPASSCVSQYDESELQALRFEGHRLAVEGLKKDRQLLSIWRPSCPQGDQRNCRSALTPSILLPAACSLAESSFPPAVKIDEAASLAAKRGRRESGVGVCIDAVAVAASSSAVVDQSSGARAPQPALLQAPGIAVPSSADDGRKFKGVCKEGSRWRAQISIGGKPVIVGARDVPSSSHHRQLLFAFDST